MSAMIGYINRLLTASLTADNQVASLPVTNLQTPHADTTNQWRTTSRTASFTADTGSSASTWRLFMLAHTNLNSNALIRWIVSDDSTFATSNYDSGSTFAGTLPGYQQSVIIAPSEVTGRYVRCSLNNASNPDPFLSVGLAYAGPVYTPGRGLSYESSWAVQTAQDIVQTRGGQQYVTLRHRQRAWDMAFNTLPSAELYTSIAEVMRTADTGQNIAFVPFSDGQPSREAIMGLLRTTSGIGYPARIAQYRGWRAQITERL